MINKPIRALLVLLLLVVLPGSRSLGQDDARDAVRVPEPASAPAPDPAPVPIPEPASLSVTAPSETSPDDPTGRVLAMVELNNLPLREAFDRLREQSGVNLFVSWNVLARAGVAPDVPVDVRLQRVTLGRVLDLILADAASGEVRLAWAYEDGVVRVSTFGDLEAAAFHREARKQWAAETRAHARLAQPLANVTLERVPFWQAVEMLAERADVPISVDWRAIEDAGVSASAPISMATSGATFEAVLGEVLDAASADGEAGLGFTVARGRIELTTEARARKATEVRVYDLTRLVSGDGDDPQPLAAESEPAGQASKPDGGAAGGNPAATPTLPRPGSGSADDIRRVIRESIDPDSWRENGGSAGSISSPGGPRFANVLVVTQTRENHERIARLLDRLHAQARPHAEAEGSAQSPARDADGAQNGAPRE